jgi:hypothetical protein
MGFSMVLGIAIGDLRSSGYRAGSYPTRFRRSLPSWKPKSLYTVRNECFDAQDLRPLLRAVVGLLVRRDSSATGESAGRKAGRVRASPRSERIGRLDAELIPPDDPPGGEKYPFTLVIARNGKVVRRIDGDPSVWNWFFWADGKQVA